MNAADRLRPALEALRAQHLYRRRRTADPVAETLVRIGGQELICFCSNDYLGLSRHPKVIEAMVDATRRYGAGSGASHLISGHGHEHQTLEEELAAFLGRERALLFSTGYMANLGTITSLLGRGGCVAQDRLNHASLIDAGLACGAKFVRYAHGDAAAAETAIAETSVRGPAAIVTDGVFSMDGDLAPLPELARAARAQQVWLIVDDAHGIGVLGRTGRGIAEHFSLGVDAIPVLIGTLGKALGSFGAFVAGDSDLCEWLVQKARTYIYTTALPPGVAAASRQSLALLSEESWRLAALRSHIAAFRNAAATLGLQLMDSMTAIQPVLLGSAERAVAAAAALERMGLMVAAIRPPSVPRGASRLRITLSAAHSAAQVERLCDCLAKLKGLGLV